MLHLDVDANLDINHCLAYSEVYNILRTDTCTYVHPKFVESQEAHIYPAISSTFGRFSLETRRRATLAALRRFPSPVRRPPTSLWYACTGCSSLY